MGIAGGSKHLLWLLLGSVPNDHIRFFFIFRRESNTIEPRMKDKAAAVVDPQLNETWKSRR
jgi:hypothetical protein